jgi:hypothetical protein
MLGVIFASHVLMFELKVEVMSESVELAPWFWQDVGITAILFQYYWAHTNHLIESKI